MHKYPLSDSHIKYNGEKVYGAIPKGNYIKCTKCFGKQKQKGSCENIKDFKALSTSNCLRSDLVLDVKGFIEESFGDWDGEPASVIFLPKCNFRCPFCHNVNLVLNPEKLETIPFQYIEDQLVKHKNWRNAVCITGGEPTLQDNLPELFQKLKQMGFKVKLDTNGTNPTMLKELLDKELVDYVAMDIKAPLTPEKYSEATGINIQTLLENVKTSLQTLMESNIDYEFRTTVVPTIHTAKDIEQICTSLRGCKKYVIQEFDVGIGQQTLNPNLKSTSWNEKEIKEFIKIAHQIIPNTKLRGNLRQIET